jgi:hypothetical protein
LIEDDVDLLFPERLTFAFLRKELGHTPVQERFFRSQNLIEWVKDDEEEVLNFSEDLLRKAIIPVSEIPPGENCLFLDIASSTSKYADMSSITAARLAKNRQGYYTIFVLDQESGRMKAHELAFALARMCRTYEPHIAYAEKPFAAELIEAEIRRTSMSLQISIPLVWLPFDENARKKDAKYFRVKRLEALLPDRLRFAGRPYVDDLIKQLLNISGTRLQRGRKDDNADSLSQAPRVWASYLVGAVEEDTDLKKLAEDQQAKAAMLAQHRRIFEGFGSPMRSPTPEEAPVASDPLSQATARLFGGNGLRLSRR